MTDETKQTEAAPDTIDIQTVDQFAYATAAWHQHKVAAVQHYFTIPPGTDITVNDEQGEHTVKLEGDALLAFKAGLMTALNELGQLPFTVTAEVEGQPANDAG